MSRYKEKPENNKNFLKTKTPFLNGNNIEEKRQEILEYFHDTFDIYESIFECLESDKSFYIKANSLRHPLIFYYGHTAVFFINKLNVAGIINERIDDNIESMLAIGVDEMSWDDLDENHYNWPTVEQVQAYRNKTRSIVDNYIRNCEITLPISWEDPLWIIIMGIEHERIHLETTSVLIRELPIESVKTHPIWSNICQDRGDAPKNSLIDVNGGKVTLGKKIDSPIYGWDNEYGNFETEISGFKASKYLVSNKEFLEFVEDGGYKQRSYWSEEGWQWVTHRQASHPVFWIKQDDNFKYRAMLEIIDMPWNWPVDINYLEAKAFCNWKSEKTGKSIRMPSEAEWHKLRSLEEQDQPTWENAPGNINLEHYVSPCPVDQFEFKNGFFDIIGNVWQWTETNIDGFEGFKVHPVYDDFSTPTFDGKHNIFKGGCWISTGNYAIKDSRYAFRRHFFQHAGLRYIEAEPMKDEQANIYESDSMVSQYIEFHYGDKYFNTEIFPVACAQICIEAAANKNKSKALDIGCATGRSSFELATVFEHVDAIDFSARFINIPTNLKKKGVQRFTVQDEGELVQYKEVCLKDFPEYEKVKDNINFAQGDACNLSEKYNGYDLIFAGNLLDRLYDPEKFLNHTKKVLNPNGLLILASPYTWLEEFTDREKWIGGFKAQTGENYTTLDGLKDILSPEFKLVKDPISVPFIIRETKRKFQHTLSELTIWEKEGK